MSNTAKLLRFTCVPVYLCSCHNENQRDVKLLTQIP